MGVEQLGLEPPTQAQEQTEAPLGGINTAAKTVVSGFFFVTANSQSSGLLAPKNKTESSEADRGKNT